MLLANEIPVFLNQIYPWSKMIKKPNFLHVDTNSLKLKAD